MIFGGRFVSAIKMCIMFAWERITLERSAWRRTTFLKEGAFMRTQNHSIPLPLKPNDRRLNSPVVGRRRPKRANAQTHGAFAEPLILPGEDPREFEVIHAALIEEWFPSGLSEQRLVFGMADAEWRKLRSRRDRDRLDPATEAFRSEIMKMHSFVTTIHMREFLDDDLEQQERLDARIARLRKELVEIKTTKQVLRRTSKDDTTDQ